MPALLHRSVGRKAVHQPGAAALLQLLDAAAARAVRRVPRGIGYRVGVGALVVVVAHDGRAAVALRPVAAGGVLAGLGHGQRAVRARAGEDVVAVDLIAKARDDFALFSQRGVLADLGIGAVQVGHAGGNDHALGVAPRAVANAIARIDGRLAIQRSIAQIGAPGFVACAHACGQRLAVAISPGQPAQVAALAGVGAGDEEAHGVAARRPHGAATHNQCGSRKGGAGRKNQTTGHGRLLSNGGARRLTQGGVSGNMGAAVSWARRSGLPTDEAVD